METVLRLQALRPPQRALTTVRMLFDLRGLLQYRKIRTAGV